MSLINVFCKFDTHVAGMNEKLFKYMGAPTLLNMFLYTLDYCSGEEELGMIYSQRSCSLVFHFAHKPNTNSCSGDHEHAFGDGKKEHSFKIGLWNSPTFFPRYHTQNHPHCPTDSSLTKSFCQHFVLSSCDKGHIPSPSAVASPTPCRTIKILCHT